MKNTAQEKKHLLKDAYSRLRSFYYVVKTTKNWFSMLLLRYGGKKSCRAYFRNGHEENFYKSEWQKYILHTHLFGLLPMARLQGNSIQFQFRGRKLKFSFGKYGFDTVFEVFAFDPYRDFLRTASPEGKQVVDIGAAFGDTAIYFLLNGARSVAAYEAFPGYYSLASQNVIDNDFSTTCEIILSAVGGETGSLVIDPGLEDMFGANMKQTNVGQEVPVVTLLDVVKRHRIEDGFLKLDTEGFEYDILLKTPKEIVRKFSDMLIEYHYGYERLESYLKECGYSYFHTGPTHVYMPHLIGDSAKNMYTGHIIAKRIG